jgi:hypothetical protein
MTGVNCQHKSEREVEVHTNQPLNDIGTKETCSISKGRLFEYKTN